MYQIKNFLENDDIRIVEDIQNLADLKNLSFNKTIISLLEFSLDNLDDNDKQVLKSKRN